MQTSTALFITNSKLSTSAHCFRTCPDDGRGRYALLFITIEIITSWRSVSSFQSYPKGLKRNLECNPCATGDEFHTQFFCILIMWKSSVVPKTVVLHLRLLYWEYLHAVLVSVFSICVMWVLGQVSLLLRHGPAEVPKFVFISVCFETHGHAKCIPQPITFSVGSPPS